MRGATRSLVLAFVLLLWPSLGWGQASVAFYSHGWDVGANGFLYFPHAFILIEGVEGQTAPETFGFTARGTDPSVLLRKSQGEVRSADPAYLSKSTRHFAVQVTASEHQALLSLIDHWRRPENSVYQLRRRNCVTFVAELAKVLGLTSPPRPGLDPAEYLERLRAANLVRLTAAVETAPQAESLPAPLEAIAEPME